MPPLTTETALNILIDWLQDNIIFDNNEDNTDSAALLPWIEQALRDVRDLRHLQLLQQAGTD
ncbi:MULTISPECIES: DUF957 domain-containing protein [Klebsiella/Raoultella group]|jgi:hypothetical protein|uniref:DUF957 domain-containing protein n=1 Tax=Klebsiella/Raoultella group TaxID=2890311 RepID=UPI00058EC66C|nr:MULTISPECIES: DUF957 domain-containing protein [Klebsiella/Raoultella group]HDK5924142.1 DUF957 domain-containing protein [Klebsiella quasipneumoniae]AUU97380.1 DUF957 domain-containing protein [Klebsiella pneumoniae]EIV9918058.1 DUF957 domain-containing protein [Klebsiella pneumoniae]EKW0023763.1 DUF957 domain-containing protein [Klebsiella pneumoniae]ELA2735112.1 DUF957 domain-containing protein [Klebsiella pneumoniae]